MTTTSRSAAATVVVTVAVLLAVAALVVTGIARAQRGPEAGTAATASPAKATTAADGPTRVARVSVPEAVRAVTVLRDWDAARAKAWAAGDPAALRRLYVARSSAGERDVAMLRRWVRRGMHVEGMTMQVHTLRLRARTDKKLVLVVTDRLARATAVRSVTGERWELPRDEASTRRLVFRHRSGAWRLDSVYDSPVASTASTSGSAKS